MLYDKRWDAKVEQKADPLSLGALIAWLEQQPASKTYCYSDFGRCLAAQYNAHIGREYNIPVLDHERETFDPRYVATLPFDEALEWIAVVRQHGNCEEQYTFGAALKRARALQP